MWARTYILQSGQRQQVPDQGLDSVSRSKLHFTIITLNSENWTSFLGPPKLTLLNGSLFFFISGRDRTSQLQTAVHGVHHSHHGMHDAKAVGHSASGSLRSQGYQSLARYWPCMHERGSMASFSTITPHGRGGSS